jgi:DNA-binding HxlR family transcriptional regulator
MASADGPVVSGRSSGGCSRRPSTAWYEQVLQLLTGTTRDSSLSRSTEAMRRCCGSQESGRHEAALELPGHLARELEVLAKRWMLQLLFLLLQRPARFSELERAVPGLTNPVMADRLRGLQDAGLVARQVDPGPPIRGNYALTTDGEALRPILTALRSWADRRAARGFGDLGLEPARPAGQPGAPCGGSAQHGQGDNGHAPQALGSGTGSGRGLRRDLTAGLKPETTQDQGSRPGSAQLSHHRCTSTTRWPVRPP